MSSNYKTLMKTNEIKLANMILVQDLDSNQTCSDDLYNM